MSVIPLSQMLLEGARRRLLLFPRGNEYVTWRNFVAVYLDFPEAPFTPYQLCPDAHFAIVAVNQKEESKSIRRGLGYPSWQALTLLCPEAHHMFTSQATDWGFSQFLPLRDTKGNRAGFVVDDTLILTVNITVKGDMDLDRLMRRHTGFVGLQNNGNKSYINSLLQCLYHVRRFRRVRIRLIVVTGAKETTNGLGGLSHADAGDG